MTAQEFAALLHGREILDEIDDVEAEQAKAHGLVVVFGYSDDNVELKGAIDEEVGAFDGTTLRVTSLGLLPDWDSFDKDDEAEVERYFEKKRAGFKEIEAVWSPDDIAASWAFRTTIPHATFDVMENDELFCRGIVFALADVANAA